MTVVEGRAAGRHDVRSALGRLVPDPERFADEVWGREPLLTRAGDLPGAVADLLDEEDVDELISARGLRTPFLRVAKDGTTLPTSAYTSGGGVGAGIADQLDDTALTRLFADGATLVLQALHRTWPALIDFTERLSSELAHPVQVNAYVTPPQSRGFDDHYDVHDVFVLQVSGAKRWRIHAPVFEAPLRDQPWTDRREQVRRAAEQECLIDTVLEPGDCLYLPRGTLHAATALGDVSTHLTFGVHTWTRHHIAEELAAAAVRALGDDVEVRRSLPLGSAADDPEALEAAMAAVRDKLTQAIGSLGDGDLRDVLSTRVRAAQRPAPVGPLAQLRQARGLGESTDLTLRRGLHLRADDPRIADLAGDVVPSVLAGEPVRAGALGLEIARRLIAEGILVGVEDHPD